MDLLEQPKIIQQTQKSGEESIEETTGTTIIALSYNGGVIVAGDTRTTTGAYIASRVSDKLEYVHDKIFCLRSGSAADTQTLSKYVRHGINQHAIELNKLPHVKTVARLFQNYMYEYKDALMASIIVAGWDPYEGPQIYAVPPGGSFLKQKYAMQGSGSGYITSYMDEFFKENMSYQEAENVAVKAVCHAMNRDGSSGGCVRLVSISKDGIERKFYDYNNLPLKN